jgi:hypothetical protein
VAQFEHGVPRALHLEDIETPHAWRQRFLDQANDLAAMRAIVAVVDLAHEAFIGRDSRDDRAAPEDVVGAAAEIALEGDPDGNRLDAVDFHLRARREGGKRGDRPAQ